ncbi:hypothetical protein [Vulgatibacter sp.]|uniref:hypothetical protein n=1 Tax=Vulgatibacter sp. TaxID=1971226 RepID=UPI0035680F86
MTTTRWIPAALLTLAACGAEAPGAGAGIAIRAVTEATPAASAGAVTFEDDTGRTFTATEFLVRVRDIELKLPDGVRCSDIEPELAGGARCDDSDDDEADDDDEIEIAGPFVVDLLAGTSTPSLADVRVPALTYREVEFDLVEGPGDGALDGNALALRATFDDGGAPATLDLRLDGTLEVEIERPEGVALQAGADLLLLLDATTWLDGIPLQACVDEEGLAVVDGVLSIDDDTGCSELEGMIRDRLDDACSFDSDDDDDDDDDSDDDDDDETI